MSDFYEATGVPSTGAGLVSSVIRAEYALIETAFGKCPTLTGNGLEIVSINSAGTAMEASGLTTTDLTTLTDGSNADSLHTHSIASATYLPLAGGTMTGDITMDGNKVEHGSGSYLQLNSTTATLNVDASNYMYFDDDLLKLEFSDMSSAKGFYVRENLVTKSRLTSTTAGATELWSSGSIDLTSDDGEITIDSYSQIYLEAGARGIMFSDGIPPILKPTQNNVTTLGGSSYRWSTIYCTTLDESSDETKKEILPIGDVSWLYNATPIAFKWLDDEDGMIHYGFGAQSLKSVAPPDRSSFVHNDEGEMGISYTRLIAPMLKLIQDQKKTIDSLVARVEELER